MKDRRRACFEEHENSYHSRAGPLEKLVCMLCTTEVSNIHHASLQGQLPYLSAFCKLHSFLSPNVNISPVGTVFNFCLTCCGALLERAYTTGGYEQLALNCLSPSGGESVRNQGPLPPTPNERGVIMVSLQQKHILLVEDDEGTLSATTAMLERLGHGVTAETEGLKALRTFSEEPDRFDLALLDHGMADVTGLEIAQRMRRIRPRFSGRRLYEILVTHLRLNN